MSDPKDELIRALLAYTGLQRLYIELLGAELESCVPMAHVHGWRSALVDKGNNMRDLMLSARQDLGAKAEAAADQEFIAAVQTLVTPSRSDVSHG